MQKYLTGIIVALVITTSFSRATFADDTEKTDAAAAQSAFFLRHYDEALVLYTKLHIAHSEKPGYLWNVARCHQFLGHADEAITYFNRYIGRSDVTDTERQEARVHVAAMEKLKAAPPPVEVAQSGPQAKQGTAGGGHAPPVVDPVVGSERGGALRLAGLITAGVGVAGLVAGALFGAQAKSAAKDLNDKAPGGVYDSTLQAIDDRGRSAQTKEWIFLGVGGAVLITGGILYLVGHSQTPENSSSTTVASVTVVPTILPRDLGAALSVTF